MVVVLIMYPRMVVVLILYPRMVVVSILYPRMVVVLILYHFQFLSFFLSLSVAGNEANR